MDARVLVVPLTLAAVACEAPPDFVTAHGVAFHLNGSAFIAREHADELEQRFLAALGESLGPPGAVEACLRQSTVAVVPEGPFACAADPQQTCAGEQYGPLLKVAAAECPYASAYTHELLHWLQQCLEDRTDYAHEAPQWRLVHRQQAEMRVRCP